MALNDFSNLSPSASRGADVTIKQQNQVTRQTVDNSAGKQFSRFLGGMMDKAIGAAQSVASATGSQTISTALNSARGFSGNLATEGMPKSFSGVTGVNGDAGAMGGTAVASVGTSNAGLSMSGGLGGPSGGMTQASFGGVSGAGASSAALSTDGATGGTGADAMNNMRAQGTSDAMFLLQFQMAMQKDAATLQCQSQIAKCTHDMQKSITQNISA